MTDDEAKKRLDDVVMYLCASGRSADDPMFAVLRHALQALDDRAALVEALDARKSLTWGGADGSPTLAAARRHMRGEE